ncbi:ABC transporter substrate-binding protein [Aquabacterium sp. NJ1]|uniref:substrate-binding periplasmic protein n=1 Tax=Aquabacterium sp. NJ1 TaxID=1538295 RepID=UPI001377DB1E|nr:transporter substrate-binding domain-containing protein [Aquabacterium sp. NJ1]
MLAWRAWFVSWGWACAMVVPTHGLAQAALPEARPRAVIGAEDDAAPWSYADGSGYVNDVVRAAFERSGWLVEFKVMPYARCKALASSGKLLACFSTSKTPALQAQLLYPVHPVFSASNLLVGRADSGLSGCDPARWPRPLRIGRVAGYEYRPAVDALFSQPQIHADDAQSEVNNLRKLQARRIDAALVTVDAVKRLDFIAAQAGVSGTFTTICDFGSEHAYIAFSRRHPVSQRARQAFEAGFEQLRKEGHIAKLQALWRAKLLDRVKAKAH